MEKHTTACQQYQGTDCVCSLTPMTPIWKEEFDDQFFATTQGRNDIRRERIAKKGVGGEG